MSDSSEDSFHSTMESLDPFEVSDTPQLTGTLPFATSCTPGLQLWPKPSVRVRSAGSGVWTGPMQNHKVSRLQDTGHHLH